MEHETVKMAPGIPNDSVTLYRPFTFHFVILRVSGFVYDSTTPKMVVALIGHVPSLAEDRIGQN